MGARLRWASATMATIRARRVSAPTYTGHEKERCDTRRYTPADLDRRQPNQPGGPRPRCSSPWSRPRARKAYLEDHHSSWSPGGWPRRSLQPNLPRDDGFARPSSEVLSRAAVARRRDLLFFTAVAILGCDGSLPPPIRTPGVDAASPIDDAATVDTAPQDGPSLDASGRSDVDLPDLASVPLPADVTPPRQIVAGRVTLAGDGDSACTGLSGGSIAGDRWCAFKRPVQQGTELWVVNLSKAVAGTVPACDGTSPDCLRLTQTLWTDEPILGPRQWLAHRFDGDTLIYHADARSRPDDPYTGPIYAWRPGWTAPRLLASSAYACYGHPVQAVALCIDNVTYDAADPVEFDLRVGDLEQPSGAVLPLVDHVLYARANRQQGYHVGFSNDGRRAIYTSARSLDSPTPDLRLYPLGSSFSPGQTVIPDVVAWQLSLDGTRIYYLSGFKDGEGALSTADFPSGANAHASLVRTGRYVVLGSAQGEDRGIGYFRQGSGRFLSEYRVIRDRQLLTDTALVFRYSEPLEDFHLSPDGRYTGYAKADPTQGFNGYLVSGDGLGECILNTPQGPPAFEYFFLDDSRLVFWEEQSADDSAFSDGWFGKPEGCHDRRLFSRHVYFYTPIRNEGLLYGDELELTTITFALKYAALKAGATWPSSGPMRIHDHVTYPLTFLRPGRTQILFQVNAPAEAESGIFLFDLPVVGGP
jgi:hypothetical protein